MLLTTALIISVYFLLTGQTNTYRASTNDPAAIYRDVCAECHGEQGEGKGLFYPALGEKEISRQEVIEIIREGAFMMPAFPLIPDTTLRKLSRFVMEKGFKKPGT